MGKTALITDIHFCIRDSSIYYINRYKLFFENIFFPYLKKHKIKRILNLGDTFENRKSVNVFGLHHAREMFFDIAKMEEIEIICLIGNHDVFYRNTNEVTSMDIIDNEYDNVRIVRGYEEHVIGEKTFGFMSWVNNENLDENLKIIEEANADYLLGHFEIKTAEMTKGNFAESGFDPSIFSKYRKVLSGHFHIKNDYGNIKYIGNPFQTNWDDYNSPRGFHIYDDVKDEFEFIENTYINFDVIIYSDDTIIDYEKYKDLKVKVLITHIADLNPIRYKQFIDELSKYVNEYSVIETKVESLNETSQIAIVMKSNMEMIKDYISELNVDDDDKKSIESIMYELYNDAIVSKEK